MRPARWQLLVALCCLPACGLPQPERDVDYSRIFVPDRLAEWKISMTNDDWHQLFFVHPAEYVPADVEIDGVPYENVGLRLVGNRNRNKMGMRIRFNQFNPSHNFHGIKRINLRNAAGDPTLIREALALHLMRKAGVPAPRSSFVWVDFNHSGGVYTLVEQIDRRFLRDRFDDNDGNLYRVETGGNLVYQGDDQDSYDWIYTYSPRTNEELADHTDLISLMKTVQTMSVAELEQELPRVLDLNGFLLTLAVNSWAANMDSYAATGRNFYIYRDLLSGRFRFIPWDMNRAFGNYHGDHCVSAEGERDCMAVGAEVCEERQCQDWAYCAEYIADLCAESPDEICEPEFWEVQPAICRQNPPEGCATCYYTTVEMIALDPEEPTCSLDRPLIEKVLEVPAFRQAYRDHLRRLIDGVLEPEAVEADIRFMRELISDRVNQDVWREHAFALDTFKMIEFEDCVTTDSLLNLQDRLEDYVPALIPFVHTRHELIKESLGGSE